MKLITRNTDYAVRAVCYIARNKGKVVSAAELVAVLKIPRPFLRKILQALNRKGVLQSSKGPGGGFILGVKPQRVFLTDLIAIFQGPFKLNECFFKKSLCPNVKTCPLNKKIAKIEQLVLRELGSITIASLLR